MLLSWLSVQIFLKTVGQIFSAGIAITAFALLLYAFQFNLRDRVASSFALILMCLVIIYTTEAIGSTFELPWGISLALKIEWVGIIMLPAAFLHFSEALLKITGVSENGYKQTFVRITYFISLIFLAGLITPYFFSSIIIDQPPAPFFQPGIFAYIFTAYYLGIMVFSWINFARAYRRAITSTSRRRMVYLIAGSLAPALGSFPFMLYFSSPAGKFPFVFWIFVILGNLIVGVTMIMMAYAVAFFGVAWPDRVVKRRLFNWILRGPVTASLALGFSTIIRRIGEAFGTTYSALVPIVMVSTILLCEFLIGLFGPYVEKWLFYGNDREDMRVINSLENRLFARSDFRQILELILAAVCDRLQASGAYVAAFDAGKSELIVNIGKNRFENEVTSEELSKIVSENGNSSELFQWGEDLLVPLNDGENEDMMQMYGLLGITGVEIDDLEDDQIKALHVFSKRAAMALHDRFIQQQVFKSIESLTPETVSIQRMRASGRFDMDEESVIQNAPADDTIQWVREALTHYWGGPRLTKSPLLQLKIVNNAIEIHDGSSTNALRSILRDAIDKTKPEGDRRFTGEWILYNILEMKFLEGRKVREIALKLAMSEADLYRKQRIAIETVAKEIQEMEATAQTDTKV
jgi:hypothetical protein